MSVTSDTSLQPAADGSEPARPDRTPRLRWRHLQLASAAGIVASLMAPMVIEWSLEPFLLMMAAPVLLGMLVALRWPGVGSILLGIFSLALLAFSAPFLVDALAHPESLADFVPLSVFAVSSVVGTLAAIPAFRERGRSGGGSGRPRAIAVAAVTVLVAAAIVSVAAFSTVDSVPPRSGDLLLVTEALEFSPAGMDAEAGTVSVHVTNKDGTRHTFTVDELGVDLNVPPSTSQRVSFQADPGTYRFYCRPHAPGMDGVLVVR